MHTCQINLEAESPDEEILWAQGECCQDPNLTCPDRLPSVPDFEEACSVCKKNISRLLLRDFRGAC